jgi:Mg-chelatase subunit ChlD
VEVSCETILSSRSTPSGRGARLSPMRARSLLSLLLLAASALLLTPAASLAARERTGSIDVFIVLDESGSMKPIFPRVTAFLADAIVRDYLAPRDYFAVIGFSDIPHVRVSQQLSSAAEKDNLADLLRNLNVVPQGYTDMGRALEETLRQLDRLADPSHEQVILILTDGLNQPPRQSAYYAPLRSDSGIGLAPPSAFNERFQQEVRRLAEKGWRVHVVGIGAETDARKLAEALGAGHTQLRKFDAEELRAGLAGFWDDTISLVGVETTARGWRPGESVPVQIRLRSSSDKDREIQLRGARLSSLTRLGAAAAPAVAPSAIPVALPLRRWAVRSRQEARFEARLALPAGLPAGDYTATLAFEQESAVKFYPPETGLSFHVPSFWERHGTQTMAAAVALVLGVVGFTSYRRRPVPVTLVVEGEADTLKPVRFRISSACSVGGGATDRFRIAGLPTKLAVLERRSVDRFALVSTKPEIVPTIPEYRLGDPFEVRLGSAPADRRTVRFVRWQRRSQRRRPPLPPAPARSSRTAGARATGDVDFR